MTPSPTKAPVTPSPTKAPVTPSPTKAPVTPSPTKAPADAPTNAPVTSVPTNALTNAPVTPAPTNAFTNAPVTPVPTNALTNAPVTSVPTNALTNAPVTPVPTNALTNAPVTSVPTNALTNAPVTPVPTNALTNAPVTPAPTNAFTNAPVTAPPTALFRTTVQVDTTLVWNITCDSINSTTLVEVAKIIEKSVYQDLDSQLNPDTTLDAVYVYELCGQKLETHVGFPPGRRLQQNSEIKMFTVVSEACASGDVGQCGQDLFDQANAGLVTIVGDGSLSNTIQVNSGDVIAAVINGITNSTFNVTSTNAPTRSPVSSSTTNAPVSISWKLRYLNFYLSSSNIYFFSALYRLRSHLSPKLLSLMHPSPLAQLPSQPHRSLQKHQENPKPRRLHSHSCDQGYHYFLTWG
jgi:hypothetical protein